MSSIELFESDFSRIIGRYAVECEQLFGKRILVTGATGMIGSYLIHLLMYLNKVRGAGLHVTGVCRSTEAADQIYSDYMHRGWYETYCVDVRQMESFEGKVDVIIHSASPTSPYAYEHLPADVGTINVIGTWRLLELAREKNARFLFTSSSSVYGAASNADDELDESAYGRLDPLQTRACYSEGKRAAEMLCAAYSRQYGVQTKIVRCRRVYGPTQNVAAKSMLNKLLCATARNEELPMFRDQTSYVQLIYVGDAVSGMLKTLFCGENGQAYNVCSDMPVTIDELAEKLSMLSQEYRLSITWVDRDAVSDDVRTKRQNDRNNAACTNRKLCALGWEPLFSLEEGLLTTIKTMAKELNS